MNRTIEDILARDGYLVYRTRGVSMEPMLRQNRDLVILRAPVSRLQKHDVALYKRDGAYVLHRVVGAEEGCYLIRGDNTYAVERVPEAAVIGVLAGFRRRGREYDASDRDYRLYARLWNAIYPLRHAWVRCRRLAGRAARRLGLRPRDGRAPHRE